MCRRFSQHRTAAEYLEALHSDAPLVNGVTPEPIRRYNVAPDMKVLILHQEPDGLRLDPVRWGYAPFWARGKRPAAIAIRAEKAAMNKFFRDIWSTGRALVAADGWYEWKKDPNDPSIRQPYFIKLKSDEPMFFAAIAQHTRGGLGEHGDDGFVIITAARDGGLISLHDRRPLVLPPDVAREWIEPDLPSGRAEELILHRGLPPESFEYYPVGEALENVKNEGPELIRPIQHPRI